MRWDPDTTLRRTLWLGGGQWAGKSTVAGILAGRHGLTHYHYDYHDARGHEDRRVANLARRGEPVPEPDWEATWLGSTPEQMAEQALARFRERFGWVLDDLRALVSPRPILADGWGLRPELVVPVAGSARQMVLLVPTVEFQRYQAEHVPRASALARRVSDPVRAQRNRMRRDLLLAADAAREAGRLGVRVIEVDGVRDAAAVADLVADHFAPFLPALP